jgi:hypothetical protein
MINPDAESVRLLVLRTVLQYELKSGTRDPGMSGGGGSLTLSLAI